jgi:hypothetical protein
MEQTQTFTKWDGKQPVQVGDVVIITGDDDVYGRITQVTVLDTYFIFTDKEGNPIDYLYGEGHEFRIDGYETNALPYADPIPNRYIASFAPFAPIEPLPFDEPVDPRDAKIIDLEARIAELEKALKTLKRRADRDADFEDWKTGQDR